MVDESRVISIKDRRAMCDHIWVPMETKHSHRLYSVESWQCEKCGAKQTFRKPE